MAKFRKKPIVVEAEQFHGFYRTPYPRGVQVETDHRCYVVTAHRQRAYLERGDWVIAEPDGRGYYPCKPDIFEAAYDPVEVIS